MLYTKLAKKYADTYTFLCLFERIHVNKYKLKEMQEESLRVLKRDTESVGGCVPDLLDMFLYQKEDFKKISMWYGDLTSLYKCFEDV